MGCGGSSLKLGIHEKTKTKFPEIDDTGGKTLKISTSSSIGTNTTLETASEARITENSVNPKPQVMKHQSSNKMIKDDLRTSSPKILKIIPKDNSDEYLISTDEISKDVRNSLSPPPKSPATRLPPLGRRKSSSKSTTPITSPPLPKNDTARFVGARIEDMKKVVSAAITIQKRIRGVEARACTAIHRMSKAAETALLKHLNPNLSPAENACNLLLDIVSVRSVTSR
jgi:hypothetical protein